jgi:hypothetical protein
MRHIHSYLVIPTIILIVVFFYLRRKKSLEGRGVAVKAPAPHAAVARPAKPEQPPEVVYMNLRRQALETTPESLGAAGHVADDQPYGLVMEMGVPSSVVTLACFADGDAGLYYKTGGGMKGGLAHESVRKAAKEFVALAQKALPGMIQTTSQPLPGDDRVRFYALTPKGVFTAETDREALTEPQNELAPLFYSGQEVVSRMRQVQEQRAQLRQRRHHLSGASVPASPRSPEASRAAAAPAVEAVAAAGW